MIKRLLIANRGEIACRVIHTAKQLGIYTIAVFSDSDRQAMFVKLADEAWHIGPSEPSQSYLDAQKILGIATQSQADAIHPGYGFLSENAEFADQCQLSGIKFIGPSSDVIRKMGSKSASKKLMESANVPLTPGYHGDDQSTERFIAEAELIGFPLLIKASAGGGGKGMRVAEQASELLSAIEAAKREAINAFGDDHLLLEKYILQPRHVEVQVFCDQQGHALYLNDRDCSIQRRHQKVLEEAPAPLLKDSTRKAMGEAAVACAKQIGYEGAGTVEFLVDANEQFYFMEMNTRLQVEHPVTEMVTGLDLVAWQIAVANGQALPITQDQVECKGHAIEARIYAEDPANQFLPDSGTLTFLHQPPNLDQASSKVRVDTGVAQGDEISIFYDPMIAKLIVWGESRELACQKMAQQLQQYAIAGIRTNTGFLQRLVSHPDFIKAGYDTGFIGQHEYLLAPPKPDQALLSAASLLYLQAQEYLQAQYQSQPQTDSTQANAWDSGNYWRSLIDYEETLILSQDQSDYQIQARQQSPSQWQLTTTDAVDVLETETIKTQWLAEADIDTTQQIIHVMSQQIKRAFRFNLHQARAIDRPIGVTLFDKGEAYYFDYPTTDHDADHAEALGSVTAPMHGKIIGLLVKLNERVEQGQPLLILEAMKMEHSLKAPAKGLVKAFLCQPGDNVESDQILVDFTADELDSDVKTKDKEAQDAP